QALANNRDLRIAVINVERARALYRIQRANQLPTIDAAGNFTKEKLPSALSLGQPSAIYQYYQAGLGIAAFEVDLFGRVRSLSHAALEQYLAQQETRRRALRRQRRAGYRCLDPAPGRGGGSGHASRRPRCTGGQPRRAARRIAVR